MIRSTASSSNTASSRCGIQRDDRIADRDAQDAASRALSKEGRLSTLEDVNDNTRPSTNVIPKRMDYEQWSTAISRSISCCCAITRSPSASRTNCVILRRRSMARLFTVRSLRHRAPPDLEGHSSGRPSPRVALPALGSVLAPEALSTLISDWVTALSMRDFAERRLAPTCADLGIPEWADCFLAHRMLLSLVRLEKPLHLQRRLAPVAPITHQTVQARRYVS